MAFDKDSMALGPYKALDLTEGGYNWGGKVLADLGADVIKIEPPGGSPTRYHWPPDPGQEEPDRSWFWEAYCFNKRGITLDIRKPEGAELLKRLASDVDFLMISSGQGYMESLGLGYAVLSEVNPRLVMASMTPFGESGPYSGYKATDLVSWAMGGMAYISGDMGPGAGSGSRSHRRSYTPGRRRWWVRCARSGRRATRGRGRLWRCLRRCRCTGR